MSEPMPEVPPMPAPTPEVPLPEVPPLPEPTPEVPPVPGIAEPLPEVPPMPELPPMPEVPPIAEAMPDLPPIAEAMPDLPPISDVLLDDATVAQLFFDVGHAAQLIAVSLKATGARRAEEPATTSLPELDRALRALLGGDVAGVQLRYRHAGEEWWDTLARTPAGVRLIRISHTRALRCGGSPP